MIVNGNIAKSIAIPDQPRSPDQPHTITIDETIPMEGTGWLALRCIEVRPDHRIRIAHSAPVFVDLPGKTQVLYQDEADHFIERMEREVSRNREILSPDALDEYQEALSIYRELKKRAIPRPIALNSK